MPPEIAAELGRSALAAALARAGKRATTAAVAAAIVPLALAASAPPASAIQAGVSVSTTVTPSKGIFNYQYSFSSVGGQREITDIELPELKANEFLTNGEGGFLGTWPSGWTVSQQLTTAFSGDAATFKSPNSSVVPAAFIELTYSGGEGFLGSGQGFTITLEAATGSTIASNAVVGATGGEGFSFSIDPPTPSATPEPGTLAILGTAIAGLMRFRRRRKV